MSVYTVTVVSDRPDFRCFLDLLYGPGREVDSDGDANPVYSRSWTFLYARARENEAPCVEIFASGAGDGAFTIQSDSARLEELAALYLFLTSGDAISCSGQPLDQAAIERLCETYSVELGRADDSVWHETYRSSQY